jgi:hypothetical protein
MADLRALRALMIKLRDDAERRGPSMKSLASIYDQQAMRLSLAHLREIIGHNKDRKRPIQPAAN